MSEPHGNSSDLHSHAVASPPEPKTPMWLPALGAALFLIVGLFLSISGSSSDESSATGRTATTAGDAGAPKP